MMLDKSWAIFLDRDGVINFPAKKGEYIESPDEWVAYYSSLDAIRLWSMRVGGIFVVTNQRWAKTAEQKKTLDAIHSEMIRTIDTHKSLESGAVSPLSNFFVYCSTDPIGHHMRKPNTGMAELIKKEHPWVDFKKTVMIGDSQSDIAFADNIGAAGFLIDQNGSRFNSDWNGRTFKDLWEAYYSELELTRRLK